MKKLFTFALALAAAAGMSASAQNMQFFVHGNPVNNGDRIDLAPYYEENMTQYNPELTVIPTVSDEMSVTIDFHTNETPVMDENWEYGADSSIKFCAFVSCFIVNPFDTFEKSGEVEAGVEKNMMTELVLMMGDYQTYEDLAVKSEFTFTAELDGEEVKLTFFVDKPSAGVDGIEADSNAPAVYYDLQGRQIADPAQGLYIVKRGSKVTKEFVK